MRLVIHCSSPRFSIGWTTFLGGSYQSMTLASGLTRPNRSISSLCLALKLDLSKTRLAGLVPALLSKYQGCHQCREIAWDWSFGGPISSWANKFNLSGLHYITLLNFHPFSQLICNRDEATMNEGEMAEMEVRE